MNTPHDIIRLTIDPFVFNGDHKAKNIIAALEAGGYCIMTRRAWPHGAVTEVCRDGEMRVM